MSTTQTAALKKAFDLPMPQDTRDADLAATAYFLALPASETDLSGFNWSALVHAVREVAHVFRLLRDRDNAERAERLAVELIDASKM